MGITVSTAHSIPEKMAVYYWGLAFTCLQK